MNSLSNLTYYLIGKLESLEPKLQGKKKLAKLLYLVDFYSFKDRDSVIGTDQYEAWSMGPLPKSFYQVLDLLQAKGYIDVDAVNVKYDSGREYLTNIFKTIKNQESKLTEDEITFIDKIFNKFKGLCGAELEKLSHQQAPWNSVNEKELIPIKTAYLLPNLT